MIALSLAEKGYRVFPVTGKVPLISDWPALATTTEKQIRTWWARFPDAGVGIATGGGLTVIDLDEKNNLHGIQEWAAWTAEHGIAWTATVNTPSGGQHVYFRGTDEARSRTGVLPGVDVRADGGYVVAYGDVPQLADLPELPGVVAELIGSRRAGAQGASAEGRHVGPAGVLAAVEHEVFAVEIAPEGTRNHALNRAAFNLGQLVGDHLTEEDVQERLTAAAAEVRTFFW